MHMLFACTCTCVCACLLCVPMVYVHMYMYSGMQRQEENFRYALRHISLRQGLSLNSGLTVFS